MPPFYIGKTTEFKVLNGYNGTVTSKRYKAIWQQERREHPELFNTLILSTHNTDVEALFREEVIQRFFDVPNNQMFINMSISRRGFGASGENHPLFGSVGPNKGKRFPGVNKGRKASQETIQRMRVSQLGKKRSDVGKLNMSEAQKLRFILNPVTQVTKLRMSASRDSSEAKRVLEEMHNGNRGTKQSQESNDKRSKTMTGKKRGSYKKRHITDDI
jgi:hypothetical protein